MLPCQPKLIRRCIVLKSAKSNNLLEDGCMARSNRTSCVVTRAQDSELPFFDAFVRHHVDKLGFDKIFVIYCDRRDPTYFVEEMRRRNGDKVEVLYRPENVKNLGRSFDLYLDRFKEYDYCMGLDADEFFAPPSSTINAWLEEQNYPRVVSVPWVNIPYFGEPVGDYADMLRTGVITPRSLCKSIFETAAISGIRSHTPILATGSDDAEREYKFSWSSQGKRLPLNGIAADADLSQRRALRRSDAAPRGRNENTTREPGEFCFVVHFNVRGAVDLVTKTLFQNFSGSERKGNNLTNPKLFETSDFSVLTLDDLPSRFTYAFEEKRLRPLPPRLQGQLRAIAAERLGSLPLDLDVQRRFLQEGLTRIGVAPERAEEIWNSDFMERLFQNVDRRFGPQFGPKPPPLKGQRRFLLDRLHQSFDSDLTSRQKFKKSLRKALDAAVEAVESQNLSGEERANAIVKLAREQVLGRYADGVTRQLTLAENKAGETLMPAVTANKLRPVPGKEKRWSIAARLWQLLSTGK